MRYKDCREEQTFSAIPNVIQNMVSWDLFPATTQHSAGTTFAQLVARHSRWSCGHHAT